ncbi:hypothetical protein IE81DRAFT_348836 [Ceraceosorus guamensis]|uniref:Uncharacterized protein n=1 Tax=Ceraceosorus guamensis TaxID=1522189 RepID=A0A316VVC6_9BASI|nr:hypothetical protein IE81DRAFT_348836 [Ceraceosorus guamensis]PWN40888.1 hypothetical protein IE81DRAFT_348836 [Ceraceosorus guamensis]
MEPSYCKDSSSGHKTGHTLTRSQRSADFSTIAPQDECDLSLAAMSISGAETPNDVWQDKLTRKCDLIGRDNIQLRTKVQNAEQKVLQANTKRVPDKTRFQKVSDELTRKNDLVKKLEAEHKEKKAELEKEVKLLREELRGTLDKANEGKTIAYLVQADNERAWRMFEAAKAQLVAIDEEHQRLRNKLENLQGLTACEKLSGLVGEVGTMEETSRRLVLAKWL